MENCFQDIIGIRGQCGTPVVPSSGLYVQDLPGIDLKTIDAVIEDSDSSVSFIEDRMRYAVNLVKNDLHTRLLPYYKQNSALESGVIGQYIDYMTPISGAEVYRGIKVRLDKITSLEFNLTDIALYSSNFTGTKTIKVWDLVTGSEIDSFDVAVVENEITYIPINKNYFNHKQRLNIFIGYDATGFDSFQTNIFRGATTCTSCNPLGGYSGRYLILNAGEIGLDAPKKEPNINYTNTTAGLSVMYNIACSNEQFLCSIKSQVVFPILHKIGVVLCDEIINGTKRVNSVTTIDRDKAIALKGDFEMIYQDGMAGVLSNLKFPNDLCFKCNQRIKTTSRIP